ncbi:MAG: hypothetical protein ACPL7K_03220, partial [Armatimonadota bacterium]
SSQINHPSPGVGGLEGRAETRNITAIHATTGPQCHTWLISRALPGQLLRAAPNEFFSCEAEGEAYSSTRPV